VNSTVAPEQPLAQVRVAPPPLNILGSAQYRSDPGPVSLGLASRNGQSRDRRVRAQNSSDTVDLRFPSFACGRKYVGTPRQQRGNWPSITTVPVLVEGVLSVVHLPHSGSVFPELTEEVASYKTSSGALQFPVDRPLPRALVEKLVRVRIAQAFPD
jgi:hypothetical protein